jgi:prophage antirepressor-like protein
MSISNQNPSTGLVPFQFESHQFRTIVDELGEPWFIAMDVAVILEYSDAYELTKRLDDDEKQNRQIAGFGPRGVTVINESGMYESLFGCSKPIAKPFKKWLKTEVLPTIRKTGTYVKSGLQLLPTADQRAAEMRLQLEFAELTAKFLGLSDTSKQRMASQVAVHAGIPTALLPAYSDEQLTEATSTLLAKHGSTLAAARVHVYLEGMGFLKQLGREGHAVKDGKRQAVTKHFWSIVGDGLQYGKNETSRENPRQTQPRWYVDTFASLLDKVEAHRLGKESA